MASAQIHATKTRAKPVETSKKLIAEPLRQELNGPTTNVSILRPQAACACGGGCPRCQKKLTLQPKLRISEPNDPYEQEADRVADQVMRMPEPPSRNGTAVSSQAETLGTQRSSPACEKELCRQPEEEEEEEGEEELIQTKSLVGQITPLEQREVEEEDEELIQPKLISLENPILQRQDNVEEAEEALQAKEASVQSLADSALLVSRIHAQRSIGQPLPASTRAFFEPRFGADFSGVRVHTDSESARLNHALNARAFTTRQDIFFRDGAYDPGSSSGRQLLAHELTHVVQQHAADLSNPAVQRESDVDDFSEEELEEYSYDENEEELGEDTGGTAQSAVGEASGTKVGNMGRISREQYLRKTAIPTGGDNIITTLRFNAWVYVEKQGGDKDSWYKVVSDKGEIGWIPAVAAALDPPEPKAELYEVQSGDKAKDLVAQWYKPKEGFSRAWNPFSDDPGDARFYVAALAFANKGRAGVKSPDDLTETSAWENVRVIAGYTIWKPSKDFLDALKGKVSSGSITKAAWDTAASIVMAVVDFVVGAASFIGGLVYGALESIYDLFAGIVDLVKMIWDVLASLFTGNIISDAKALWDNLQTIDPGAIWEDFKKKWNAESVAERWFFRGRVLGYIIMEIVMLVFSGGALTAIKWAGKFAKIGKLLATLPKVVEVASKMAKAVKAVKLPEKALELLKFKKVGKGAKILEGIEAGIKSIEAYLKSVEHLNKRAAAWVAYTNRGGKKSKAVWEKMYDTLTHNRLKGKLAEEQFSIIMKGSPQDIWVKVGGKMVLRKVDNVLGTTAREIKSGPLKLTPFIERQILKDIEVMKLTSMKVEWHLLAGGDARAIAALKKAGIDVILY